jgi:hypothetical protein
MVDDTVFVGDAIYRPGAAGDQTNTTQLWQSTQKLLSLPDNFRIHTAHDEPPRPITPNDLAQARSSLTISRARNNHIAGLNEAEFTTLCRKQSTQQTSPSPRRTSKVPRHIAVRPSTSSSARSWASREKVDSALSSPLSPTFYAMPKWRGHVRNTSEQSESPSSPTFYAMLNWRGHNRNRSEQSEMTVGTTQSIGRAVAVPMIRLPMQRVPGL